jgi:hypothetical protein
MAYGGEGVRGSPDLVLPASEARGEGDHAKHGGGVAGAGPGGSSEKLEIYGTCPSTTLRVVPLPICDGEDDR